MANILDADVLDLALEPMGLMHRTDALVREHIRILLAALAVRLFWRYDVRHTSVY